LQHLATFIKETSKRQLPKETSTLRAAASQLDRLHFHSSPVSKAHMTFLMRKEVTKKSQNQKSPIPPAAAPQGMQTDYCLDYSQIPSNLHRLETPRVAKHEFPRNHQAWAYPLGGQGRGNKT
jgi:hypothetical protein